MESQNNQQHSSRQLFVNNIQAAAARPFSNPAQISISTAANTFANTVENPGQMSMNQPQINQRISAPSGMANMQLSNDQRRGSRDLMQNQVNSESIFFQVPDFAPQNIKDEMIAIRDTERMLFQQSKWLKMQFEVKQKQVVEHLVESVRTPILKKLKEKDEEIEKMEKLNMLLQTNVKKLLDEKMAWTLNQTCSTYALAASLGNKLEAVMAEVNRLQGLVPPNGAMAAPGEQQDVKTYCSSNVPKKNTITLGNGQVVAVQDGGEIAAEKVRTGTAGTGEGSGEKRMCMSCGKVEMSVLAWPCRHLCFCLVCGISESRLQGGPCLVCETTITETVPVSFI